MQATEICVPDDPAAMGAAIAAMGLPDIDALIDQAIHPGVPLAVFLAALDRYTVLTRVTKTSTTTTTMPMDGAETQPPGQQRPSGQAGTATGRRIRNTIPIRHTSQEETAVPAPTVADA